jgi:hypothetical protein
MVRHGYNSHVVCYYATMADDAERDGFVCGLTYWQLLWETETEDHFH